MKPSGGSVNYDGSELYKLSRDKLAEFRRVNIGYVFQHFNLLPMLPRVRISQSRRCSKQEAG